ncbi:MAG TPA: peptide chain release factor N(5)-glutamine methyltransferase [Longilinea sp.]|nr:peptide chain release factor N(5)-glutamine methyltransferase [Longilinea sp.]
MQIDLAAWLQHAQTRLAPVTDTPLLEAQWMAAETLQKTRTWVITHSDLALSEPIQSQLEFLLTKRGQGNPLPYLFGHWEFYGFDFVVTPQVLIPRPETELMVELANHWINTHPGINRAVDVGTGSGCIPASLAKLHPSLSLIAIDCSWVALQVAKLNFQKLGTHNVSVLCGDLLTMAAGPFDLVCANLPYIPTPTLNDLPVSAFEPRLALDGGEDGFDLIKSLLQDSQRWMAPGGCMLLEIESGQGESAPALAASILPEARVELHRDLADRPRVVEIRWEG